MRVPLSRCMLAVLALVLFTTVPLAAQTGAIAGTATNPRTNIPAAGARVEAIAGDRVVATATLVTATLCRSADAFLVGPFAIHHSLRHSCAFH